MAIPKFDPKELKVVSEKASFMPGAGIPIYDFPVTPREAYRALYEGKPIWQMTGLEYQMFAPRVNPDNIARAMVIDGSPFTGAPTGGKDMFGIDWEFVPSVGGSIVHPGKPLFTDANDWEKKIVWPDVDSWNWKENGEQNKAFLSDTYWNQCWFQNGWFERLISFMDFEPALMALFDEDQQDATKAFFDKLADLYIDILDHHFHYFPQIDEMYMHDDWGSQKETFFSPALCAEMIVPSMKKVTDFIHSTGRFAQLHSCGQIYKQVPNMAAAGWDAWSGQAMNDSQKIYNDFGDKLLIGVSPDVFDPTTADEDEQRAVAKSYAERFCQPGKPSYFGMYWNGVRNGSDALTLAFREELYKQSRINYGK
ncbi:MAG: methyltransferase [Oscillospiraceae bacterium]|jgi:hypothetical protein|nr:methyltransferase [Oscillospiraceae bacterium]